MKNNEHTFVICAYKESPFLEKCIQSLKKQTRESAVIMVTSTPNPHIFRLAEAYNIPLYINEGQGGIVQDWNFGYSKAKTPYVTIAHQDDIYFKDYTKEGLHCMKSCSRPLIFFSDYCELREGRYVHANKLLVIKRLMLLPLRPKPFWNSVFVRRRILSFGSPICCPSVMYAKDNLPDPVFRVGFRSNEDWEAWEMISRIKGAFAYSPRPLMAHRIHGESETSAIISENKRSDEDVVMYSKFWPGFMVKILVKLYAKAQKSNSI